MTYRTTFAVPPLSVLAIVLALAFFAGACDDPPTAPEPSVNVDEKQQELRQEVDEVQSEANERLDKVEAQLPDEDTGSNTDAPAKQ